jgi:hypothetical protein
MLFAVLSRGETAKEKAHRSVRPFNLFSFLTL